MKRTWASHYFAISGPAYKSSSDSDSKSNSNIDLVEDILEDPAEHHEGETRRYNTNAEVMRCKEELGSTSNTLVAVTVWNHETTASTSNL